MKFYIIIAILLAVTLMVSCDKDEYLKDGDFFYLESEKSIMPVWIKGNKDPGVFIILLHGGPEGGSSQYYTIFPSHKMIEKEYAIVYWDQRMCGMSQGNPSMEKATLQQFTDDLDKLVEVINHKYDHPQLFLMGHSWGGALGTNYLLQHQDKIKGWIEIDGGHNWSEANALAREKMLDFSQSQILSGNDAAFWTFARQWYEEHPVVGINDNAHYSFVAAANGYDFNPESDSLEIPFADLLFFSPISTAYFFVPYHFDFLDNGLDLQQQLAQITIPSLICWGEHDGVFPVAIGHNTYQQLGSPEHDKYLRIFSFSAHSPNYEEPTAFANAVLNFVNGYAN